MYACDWLIMGFSQKSESNSDHAIAGAVSGFVTRFLCQPLDVIKIRFQVNFIMYIIDTCRKNHFNRFVIINRL